MARPTRVFGAFRDRLAAAALLAAVLFVSLGSPARAGWDPVAAADLVATESATSPGADVEILLSTHLLEESGGLRIGVGKPLDEGTLVTEHFVRAKVYTAKGVQDQGKFRIEFPSGTRLARTDARVVKRDGKSIELKSADMFESVLVKTHDNGEWKQITFVFPGLEAGDVVEYRWTEVINGDLWLQRYFCQEAVPVREYRFTVGKMRNRGSIGWLNCPKPETSDRDGFMVTFRNLPAFEEEAHMPAEREFRGWLYVAKTFPLFPKDEDVWKELSRYWADDFNLATKPGSVVRKKAESLAAGAAADEEKLRRLYEFCRTAVFNTTYRTSAELQSEIEKHKDADAQSPARTLELGRGRWDEINRLFAALARGLGFEAREARTASRDELLNVRIPRGWAFLRRTCVAVKVGDQWRFFDPGSLLTPFGMVGWRDEGAVALICDLKKLEQIPVPVTKADRSEARRKGRFTLDAEGTLEGEVEESFSGHLALARKWENWAKSQEDADKAFRDEVVKRLPNAEVSEISWVNLQSVELPLAVKYRVRLPGYAEPAGKRLVFAPSFFASGRAAVFAAPDRKYAIMFEHPWGEHDDIEIVLPEGYTLDKPSAPAPVGELAGAFGAAYKLQYNPKTRTFAYLRDFALGTDGSYAFRLESYPALKSRFEQLHKSDMHSIMLKPREAGAAGPTAAPAAETATSTAAAQP